MFFLKSKKNILELSSKPYLSGTQCDYLIITRAPDKKGYQE